MAFTHVTIFEADGYFTKSYDTEFDFRNIVGSQTFLVKKEEVPYAIEINLSEQAFMSLFYSKTKFASETEQFKWLDSCDEVGYYALTHVVYKSETTLMPTAMNFSSGYVNGKTGGFIFTGFSGGIVTEKNMYTIRFSSQEVATLFKLKFG